AGWPIFLLSKNSWENIEYQDAIEMFQNQMFSSSDLNIEELIDYFGEIKKSTYYIGNLQALISEAKNKCKDEDEYKRIKDIEKYLEYVILRSDLAHNVGTDKKLAREKLLNFIFNESSGLVVHSWG